MSSLMVGDVGGEVESDDDVEVKLEVGGKISSRDDRSAGNYVKVGFDVRINASVD